MPANLTTKLGQLVDVLTPDTTNTRIGVANASPTRTLDVTGTFGASGASTLGGALTYGGVTLSNAVTGTDSMVLSASPTLTGTLTAAAVTATSLALGGATLGANALAVTGSTSLNGILNLNNVSSSTTVTANGASTTLYPGSFYAPSITNNGSVSLPAIGSVVNPQVAVTSTSGTGSTGIYGGYFFPNLVSSDAASRITLLGLLLTSVRGNSSDISSYSGNAVYGLTANVGHSATVSSTAYSAVAYGVLSTARALAGTVDATVAFSGSLIIASSAGTTVGTTTTASLFSGSGINIGNATGTAFTVTNLYGLYLPSPTVGANATITNRYGVYSGDASGKNYFAGSVGIGMTPSNVLDITQNQNGGSTVKILNNSATANASAQFQMSNGTTNSYVVQFGSSGTGTGLNILDCMSIQTTCTNGMRFGVNASTPYIWYQGSSEVARFDTGGQLMVGTTSNLGSISNAAPVIGGLIITQRGSVSVGSSATVTMFSTTNLQASYLVHASINVADAPNYACAAWVLTDQTSTQVVQIRNGANGTSITASGQDIRFTNGAIGTQIVYWGVTRIGYG